jgi:hypothetical protein
MIARENFISNITMVLTFLRTHVELRGSMNLYDINIHAENFYRDFFNLLYDWDLEDLNVEKKNASYIDLVDKGKKKAIQVTSQNDSEKIKHTIKGFLLKRENKDFDLKVILIAKSPKDYTADFTFGGKANFDHEKDIIDTERLLKIIKDIKKLEKLESLSSFLLKQIKFPREKTESTEVETIMSLIEFLSKDENTQDTEEKPSQVDPERKFHRFEEHQVFLESQYSEMYAIHFSILGIAKEKVGLDGVRAKKIAIFLKNKSDVVLNDCNNMPRTAIEQLTEFFELKLTIQGFTCDQSAIRFYLLDELINCNVFPNPINQENANI